MGRARTGFPNRPHDHARCVTTVLAAAEAMARTRRVRLTPLRRRVLEIVARGHRPFGAYDVLAELAKAEPERARVAPPTVYRALDFLLAQGLIHRIDSRNAFVTCFAPERPHRAHFLLCEACGQATEIRDAALAKALEGTAAAAGFSILRETVEIAGRCADCGAEVPRP